MNKDFMLGNNEEKVKKRLFEPEIKQIEKNFMQANNAIKRTSRVVGNLMLFDSRYDKNAVLCEMVAKAYENSLHISGNLRDVLFLLGGDRETINLPLEPKKENIQISFRDGILCVIIPRIAPRNPIKKRDLDPVRAALREELESFQNRVKIKPFKEYVLLEKYIFPKDFPRIRDLERMYSSHLVDEICRSFMMDDNFYTMQQYIRMAVHEGNKEYTILYFVESSHYQAVRENLESPNVLTGIS